MSTAEILSLVSLISYIVAGVCAVLAVFFWFAFQIPSVIGDLSGRTARKSIARMRSSNERSGGQGFRPSATNAGRGKLTDTMSGSKKPGGQSAGKPETGRPETGLLDANRAHFAPAEETAMLDEATTLLADEEETAQLVPDPAPMPGPRGSAPLVMLDQVIFIHTSEVI